MALDTTTTTANDLLFASWVGDRVLDEARPYNVSKPLFRIEGPRPTKAFDFPVMTDPGAQFTAVSEGTAFTLPGALSTTKATATAAQYGSVTMVEDVLQASAIVDAVSYFSQVLGRSIAEVYEIVCSALYAGFANAVTASGIDATVADFIVAMSTLEANDAVGSIVAVLHPVTVGDLRADLSGNGGAVWGSPSDKAASLMDIKVDGYAGNLLGVDVFMTSAVPTANSSADRAGGMFVKGEALGLYELWGPRTESHRDIFEPGTQIAVTADFGVVEIRDVWGVEFTFDA